MIDEKALPKFAVKVVGIQVAGNWDRPLGYDGTARFIAVYWDQASDEVFITDGISGATARAWWLYTNLVNHEARPEINAALMACGIQSENALGNSNHEAAYALILDRFEHCLWIGEINETTRFLDKQYRRDTPLNADSLRSALASQKGKLFENANIHSTAPCHCVQGWILVDGKYVPCPDCQCTGRIEIIPQKVIL